MHDAILGVIGIGHQAEDVGAGTVAPCPTALDTEQRGFEVRYGRVRRPYQLAQIDLRFGIAAMALRPQEGTSACPMVGDTLGF
ncbi:hypothetical protein GWE18_15440 [Bradyrhizobium sp. CSA112]|uniref:hypothetical protein n=1 Tax=Bradyrhizobium sp. CSA112 TaxID=2699170 RepID=UPI0023B1A6B6|nr:hypothetical protein [Bradyrhizobium sp. CSA112]MDE5454212.1 hypothetical protein [Bradyrhizobium sp. CSA112]